MTIAGALLLAAMAVAAPQPAAAPVGAAQSTAAHPDRISEADAAAIGRAVDRGVMIYAYDQTAWHGTDDMRAKIAHPETTVGGWIVDGPANAPELIFYDQDQADPHAVYVASFRDGRLASSRVLGPGDDRALGATRKAMIAAKRAAAQALVASGEKRCIEAPFNTVLLPPAHPGDPILVYFLTPQTKLDTIPFGGHYLVEVAADGKTGPPRKFTNSCLTMPLGSDGHKPVALFITHILDPVPTEIHVFTSLSVHMPVIVMTGPKRIWAVTGGKIELMPDKPVH